MKTSGRLALDFDGYAIHKNIFGASELAIISSELEAAIQRSQTINEAYLEEDGTSVFLVGDLSRCSPYWSNLKKF